MNKFKSILFGAVLAVSSFADNPLSTTHYLADPTALVIGDKFWIICDLDDESVTGYNIKAYYAFSSYDMKNWTDHGEVFRVPRDVSWAGNAWAPGAAYKNNTVYVYFPNGASGVGVITAPTPVGPYKDPNGKAIISGAGCDGIAWCFDPGVFVDTDGQGYLIWGGGENAARPYGNNFSMVKLNANMTSYSGSIMKMSGMNRSFEAPYITKKGSTYYLSYNSQSQTIDYATSTSPTGPWSYKGTVMGNPSINGKNINANNNNHHGFAEYKGKWYAAYHDRRLAIANNDSKPDLHRNISIEELQYNTDGTFKSLVFTNAGPTQIANFNPYDSIPALTSSLQKGIRSRTYTVTNAAPYHLVIPKPSGTSFIRVSNVDFGTSASKFVVNAASLNANNKVEIRTGSETGTLAGTCALPSTGSWTSFTTTECAVTGLSGVVANVYLKFTGSDSTSGIKWWKFIGSGGATSSTAGTSSAVLASSSAAVPQTAYSSAAIPGTIQAENYDVGGEDVAYHDSDPANSGNAYRTEGVDIEGDATSGYKVGYTVVDEWLEYTVNVTTAGSYDWEASVSAGGDGSAFQLSLDGTAITESVTVPNTGAWTTYSTVKGKTPALTAGKHVLRLDVKGAYFNIDWIKFTEASVGLNRGKVIFTGPTEYTVFNMHGEQLGTVTQGQGASLKAQVSNLVSKPGLYLVKSKNSSETHRMYITETMSK